VATWHAPDCIAAVGAASAAARAGGVVSAVVIPLMAKRQLVSTIRDRKQAFDQLLPKILGLLWERAIFPPRLGPPGAAVLLLGQDVEISGGFYNNTECPIRVYAPTARNPVTKVLSITISTRVGAEIVISSWKRGPWEDRIFAEAVEPRTIAHLSTAGLVRPC
jgi:hypothetical protein